MATELSHHVDPPGECPYLPREIASLESRILVDVTAGEWESMMILGWRRFGPVYFRPRCSACAECVPIRIPTDRFTPSRSQKRAWKACAGLSVSVAAPTVDDERLALYAKWHAMREATRGWAESPLDPATYEVNFAFPHPASREVTIRDGDRLLGVALSDETPNAWSAIYFYHDPDARDRSLGTFNVLAQLAIAKSRGIPHVYLGFRVLGCQSMRYKAAFRPHQLLVGRPDADEEPVWAEGQ